MSLKAVGMWFVTIAAFLYAMAFVTAAIFMSGVSSWSASLFNAALSYVGKWLFIPAAACAILGGALLLRGFLPNRHIQADSPSVRP